jgi:hypothetical protein
MPFAMAATPAGGGSYGNMLGHIDTVSDLNIPAGGNSHLTNGRLVAGGTTVEMIHEGLVLDASAVAATGSFTFSITYMLS